MPRQGPNRGKGELLFACTVFVTVVFSLGTAAPTGQTAEEGVFVPPPRQSEATAPFPPIHHLVGHLVRIEVGSPPKEIVGRLVSIDSKELVLSIDGTRRAFPRSDVGRVETAPKKTDRTGRWLTVAGLAGMVAAYLFGQVGGY